MADDNRNIIQKVRMLSMELRIKLEVVSKWRAECAQLQMEFLKLYTAECLEILESLKLPDTRDDSSNND